LTQIFKDGPTRHHSEGLDGIHPYIDEDHEDGDIDKLPGEKSGKQTKSQEYKSYQDKIRVQ